MDEVVLTWGPPAPFRRSVARHNGLSEDNDIDGVVVDHCEPSGVEARARDADTERTALSPVNIELSSERARFREFHDLTRLGRIAIDRIAIAGDHVSVRFKH
jgi:hypothetical protein